MNKERILLVADTIEKRAVPGLGFNMNYTLVRAFAEIDEDNPADGLILRSADKTGRDCGTIACIAGWSCVLEDGGELSESATSEDFGFEILDRAEEWLELTRNERHGLFLADAHSYFWPDYEKVDEASKKWPRLTEIEPELAVRVLRNFAETGVIDWSI